MNTFNSFCIGACLFICLVGMAGSFVGALGVLPSTWDIGLQGDDTGGVFSNLTENITSTSGGAMNFDSFWLIATGGIAVTGIILGILMQSTNMIAVWIFGTVFWSGWIKVNSIFYAGGFLDNTAGIALVSILWFGMMIMFIGAIIGMLGQSGGLR